MIIDQNNAMQWVERFLNGETTNDEEQQLYRFFANNDIPAHLKPYQEMFSWYENGMIEDELPKPKARPFSFNNRVVRYVRWGIAATVLLTIGFGLGYYYQPDRTDYSLFEGSYIIRDGKKITDIKQIYDELYKTHLQQLQRELEQQQERDIIWEDDENSEELPII